MRSTQRRGPSASCSAGSSTATLDRSVFERSYELRIIGTCRHYALLAASIFRHHGIPSRLRVGFATYFVRGFHEDHCLCEYWDRGAWRLLDAELGEEVTTKEYAIDFEPFPKGSPIEMPV